MARSWRKNMNLNNDGQENIESKSELLWQDFVRLMKDTIKREDN